MQPRVFALVIEHRGPEEQQHAGESEREMRHAFEAAASAARCCMRSMTARPSSRASDSRVHRPRQRPLSPSCRGGPRPARRPLACSASASARPDDRISNNAVRGAHLSSPLRTHLDAANPGFGCGPALISNVTGLAAEPRPGRMLNSRRLFDARHAGRATTGESLDGQFGRSAHRFFAAARTVRIHQ